MKNLYKPIACLIGMLMLTTTFSAVAIAQKQNQNQSKGLTWEADIQISDGTSYSVVYMGEATDATDGGSPDSYDTASPPAPPEPSLYSYFNAGMSYPYNKLYRDIKQTPGSGRITKTWNYYTQWVGDGTNSITISWNTADFNASSYTSISLRNASGVLVSDMKTTNSFTFDCPEYTPQNFQIRCWKA
jgi:hypothetical protein